MPSRLARVVWLVGVLSLAGCSGNPYYDPEKPHHTPDGFRNVPGTQSRGSFFKWQWQRLWNEDQPAPPLGGRYEPRTVEADAAFLQDNGEAPTVTWIGHATLLVQYKGLNVLTDPHFTERASPLDWLGPKREVPPALTFDELPHIDIVVISHNHYDHLDAETVRRLAAQPGGSPRFFVPLGLKPWLADEGIDNAVELDWWQHSDHRGLRMTLVPAQHFSARTPFDRFETLWGGWVVSDPDFRFYFAGDTGYSRHFREIGERLGPFDLAALPIGAYEPRWFMKPMHINPEEAMRAHQDLRARYSVGMHWGTFNLTDEPINEPPIRLAEAASAAGIAPERFFVMAFGETRLLAPLLQQGQIAEHRALPRLHGMATAAAN